MTLSYLRIDLTVVRALVLLAKAMTAAVTVFLCLRTQGFVAGGGSRLRLSDSILPLFVGMTLLSPLVWEHHAVFLTLPFLLLVKKLESPAEWIMFGAVYLLVFLMPTFDYFPWSYGRLAGILSLLALLWITRARSTNTFFPILNAWAESIFGSRAPAKAA
jgi:hypothetical protein